VNPPGRGADAGSPVGWHVFPVGHSALDTQSCRPLLVLQRFSVEQTLALPPDGPSPPGEQQMGLEPPQFAPPAQE
jgi:hypothetical protein